MRRTLSLLIFGSLVAVCLAADKQDEGFAPLFNGKDLTGWVNVNCAPSTFFVKDNQIITTGKPTGYMRTTKQYENFIAEFEWMHIPAKPDAVGNSGFFVWGDPLPAVGTGYTRGIEVQVLVNLEYKDKKSGAITATSHGDLFSIWGATCVPDRPHPLGWARCLPSENNCKGANEWNHYRVEANDGVIKLTVNGKLVSGVSQCKPRKGYLALESEGSECRFRNLKIKELPSTNPKPEEIADMAQDFKNLYTGLDLDGWKADEEAKKHWQPKDWMLHADGQSAALRTEKAYGDSEFIVDVRFPKKDGKACVFNLRDDKVTLTIKPDGEVKVRSSFSENKKDGNTATAREDAKETAHASGALKPAGQWNRLHVTLQGTSCLVKVNEDKPLTFETTTLPAQGTFWLHPESEMDFGNLFVREVKK